MSGVNRVKLWIMAGRPFVLPWMAVNTLFPIALAGFRLETWLLAFTITTTVLIAGHYLNNWRDYARGVDKLNEGSTVKPYTAASQILPRGLLSPRTMLASSIAFFMFAALLLLPVLNPVTVALFTLGLIVALTYTDWLKPRGLGEVGLFLGHGFATVLFTYSLLKPLDMLSVGVAILLGTWSMMVLTLDQYVDPQPRGLARALVASNVEPSRYMAVMVGMIYLTQWILVLSGLLSYATLYTFLLAPMLFAAGVIVDRNPKKGLTLLLIAMFAYPLIAALSILL